MRQQKNQNNMNFPPDIDSWTSDQMLQALQWHIDHDCAEPLEHEPLNKAQPPTLSAIGQALEENPDPVSNKSAGEGKLIIGAAQAITEAMKLAAQCNTLDDLKQAIQDFNGLSLKKTATNMVFSDGNPNAKIMVIGEAPGADEDSQGKPFAGIAGQLLDKILASIGLDRKSDDDLNAVYISNILNWRPPGNRSPTQQEIEISLPFIERHIALVDPDFLILCGGVAGKSLLRSKESISRLRGDFHRYQPPQSLQNTAKEIRALVTYHPDYLLKTPAQKRAVWHDMLMLKSVYRQK